MLLEKLKERIKKTMLCRTKQSHTITMIAGAYILYLAYDMFNIYKRGEESGPVIWIGIVLFTVTGLMFLLISGIAVQKGLYAPGKSSGSAENETAEELPEQGEEYEEGGEEDISEADEAELTDIPKDEDE